MEYRWGRVPLGAAAALDTGMASATASLPARRRPGRAMKHPWSTTVSDMRPDAARAPESSHAVSSHAPRPYEPKGN